MAFCSKCGAEVEGKFCAKCGAPVGEAGTNQQQPPAASAGAGMEDNLAGTLCYVLGFITGILFLVLEPYNKKPIIRFHAFQSIFLSVGWIILSMALNIVFGFILPWSISLMLSPLIGLAGFVLWVFMMYKTYQNEKVVLPIVGPIAEKQA